MVNLNEADPSVRLSVAARQHIQSIDLQSQNFKRNPAITWKRLQRQGPVVTTKLPLLGRIALTTRFQASQEILRDSGRFSVDARACGHKHPAGMRWWVPPMFRPLANNLLTMDGQEHRSLRQRVDFAFKRAKIDELQTDITRLTRHLVDNLLTEISVHGKANFITHVARPLPQTVISQLLGLSAASTSSSSPLAHALSRLGSVRHSIDLFRTIPAIRQITRCLNIEIRQRRNHPQDDLLSLLVAENGEGRPLNDQEVLSMVFLLYVAGHETTTHLLSASLLLVLSEPEIHQQLTAPIDSHSINEFIRFLSPVQMTKPRFVLQDMDFHGARLHQGDTIAALIGAANRDDLIIPDAHRFMLNRASSKHLGFGTGHHVCLGLHLALSEVATALNEVLFFSPQLTIGEFNKGVVWNQRLGISALDRLELRFKH